MNLRAAFSLEGFGFIQGVILARLLVPGDYGLIAMTQIFFCGTSIYRLWVQQCIDAQKVREEIDYSAVFVTNIVLTFLFAILLSICAPFIANFSEEPILQVIIRANAFLLVLNSVNAVQATRLRINLQFEVYGFINVVNNVTIGIVIIIFAYLGFGVWSLIYLNFISPFLKYG